MNSKQNVYDEITDRIIAALEAGTIPWLKPWNTADACKFGASADAPYNASTRRPYSGINVILLWFLGPPGTPAYMTYKQAETLGAQVRGGSKGYRVVFFDRHTKVNPATGEEETYGFLKRHTVFHVSQIDNLPAKYLEPVQHEQYGRLNDEAFNAWVASTNAEIRPGGTSAFYMPGLDYIGMPPLQTFESPDYYKSTLLHELTHWTGAKRRLDRGLNCNPYSSDYAQEELIAEMGAAFLCARHGVQATLRHADYIGHWVKRLKSDNKAVFKAAAAAQKAADYLFDLQRLPIPASRALVPYRSQLPAAVEPTRVRQCGGLWTVEVMSPVHGRWIVQGEHRSRIAAEIDRQNWWRCAA